MFDILICHRFLVGFMNSIRPTLDGIYLNNTLKINYF
jgi:hypothetical protein